MLSPLWIKRLWMAGGIALGGAAVVGTVALVTRKKKPTLADEVASIPADALGVSYLSTIKGQLELKNASETMAAIAQKITDGSAVFGSEDTLRTLTSHKGIDAIDLVLRIFYDQDGKFSFDELSSHSSCKTWAAEIVGLGNDYEAEFYGQVYRTPTYHPTLEQWLKVFPNGAANYNPNVVWGGLPIDPHDGTGAFEAAVRAAINADQQKVLNAGDLTSSLTTIHNILLGAHITTDFSKLTDSLMSAMPPGYYVYAVPTSEREWLARFARDMSKKNGNSIDVIKDSNGNPVAEPMLTVLQASLGLGMVAKMIQTFESHDPKVNPCIEVVDAGLIFQMFASTLGVVISLAFGPVLSAVSVAVKFATTVQQLANLAK